MGMVMHCRRGGGWWRRFAVEAVLEAPFSEVQGVVGFTQVIVEESRCGRGGGEVDFGDEVEAS